MREIFNTTGSYVLSLVLSIAGFFPSAVLAKQLVKSTEGRQNFAYSDRLLYAANSINLAVDAFNKGNPNDFLRIVGDELSIEEKQSLKLQLRGADRLPNAFIVDAHKIVLQYVNGDKFEKAGFEMDFSKIGEGILKINDVEISYNSSRSFTEWKDLISSSKSDISMIVLVPQAHAFIGELFSALGSLIAGIFGGGISTAAKSSNSSNRMMIKKSPSAARKYSQYVTNPNYSPKELIDAPKAIPVDENVKIHNNIVSKAKPTPFVFRSLSSKSSDNTSTEESIFPVSIKRATELNSSIGNAVANTARSMWGHVDQQGWPNKNLKCALQTTNILKRAGILNRSLYRVVDVVGVLKGKGWKVSKTPAKGAIAYSNPLLGTKSQRSHIGVVGSDLAVYHNSGSAGGKIIRSTASDNDYNGRWIRGVNYLLPPQTNTALKIDYKGDFDVRMAYLAQYNS